MIYFGGGNIILNIKMHYSNEEANALTKKGMGVWIFSTLTAIAAAHLIDAANALLFNKPIVLLQLYPVA